jgi:hypothetical protein
LKSTYINRIKNRRVDRLVYFLVNDIEPNFIQNTKRIQLNIGRMEPQERRRRKGEINAEAVNETVIPLVIRELKDNHSNIIGFTVASFITEEVFYNVEVVVVKIFVGIILHANMCPSLKGQKNSLLFTDTINLPAHEIHTSIVPETLENNPNEHEQMAINLDGIEVVNNLQTIINVSIDDYKNDPDQFTNNQIEALINIGNTISNILNKNNQPSNQNFVPQR